MDATQALGQLGGTAPSGDLLRLVSRRRLRRALADGTVVQPARGWFALPATAEAARVAAGLNAVVCLRSAAEHWGWALKQAPQQPEVAVRPARHVSRARRASVRLLFTRLTRDDVEEGVTSKLRTVLDCARHLPFDEALAVADSAMRAGDVTREELDAQLDVTRGPGSVRVRRVLVAADGRAANPFESVLRALAIEAGLDVEPQQPVELVTGNIHPDLVARDVRLVLEADSWTFHGSRKAHATDCARYTLLVLHGWRVLRFSWEQVMHRQSYVRWVLRLVVDGVPERPADHERESA